MNKINSLRKRAGLTQIEASEKVGVSWRTWQDWERGVSLPKSALVQYFMLITDQHPDYMLSLRGKSKDNAAKTIWQPNTNWQPKTN